MEIALDSCEEQGRKEGREGKRGRRLRNISSLLSPHTATR